MGTRQNQEFPRALSLMKEAAVPLDLIERLRQRNVGAFIGAGLSVPLGMPSWGDLITQIIRSVSSAPYNPDFRNVMRLEEAAKTQPEWTAEVLHNLAPEKYFKVIRDVFRALPTAPLSFAHSLLALLPFRLFLTTNFDPLLENYVKNFDWFDPVVLTCQEAGQASAWTEDGSRRILKLHGSIGNQLVLKASDYAALLTNDHYYRFLASIFSRFAILTLGYSLRDREFRSLIEDRERVHLDCPPMYCVIKESETCPAEITAYDKLYNVRIIPVSDYGEVTSLLLSLYCLVHRVDSSIVAGDIARIIDSRGFGTSRIRESVLSSDEERVLRLLSVFWEPIDLPMFTTLCTDQGIDLTPAHYQALGCDDGDGQIGVKQKVRVEPSDRIAVGNWIAKELERVPVGAAPRYFSVYHKTLFDRHIRTIESLLLTQEGWGCLVVESANSLERLSRLNEYLRQAGFWKEWLQMAEIGEGVVKNKPELFLLLLRTKAWVYFWSRRYDDLKSLLDKVPEIDDKKGEASYRERLQYMDRSHLEKFVKALQQEKDRDYFSDSLLGRAYARVATLKTDEAERKSLFSQACTHLRGALEGAKKKKDLVETSVQSWYLACVLNDLGEAPEAQVHLAEVRRLDESIMNRIPGLAWLRVAEYRFEVNRPKADLFTKSQKRTVAIEAMTKLGVINAEEFVDKDYYF